tara:strand:+ start:841 stop:1062 length:222 start_codon:yes stop_codon:yes gene_type:complete
MKITKILSPLCRIKPCTRVAVYEFTDAEVEVKISDEDGMSATSVETVTIGYSCEHHVEEVNKILKEVYNDERT